MGKHSSITMRETNKVLQKTTIESYCCEKMFYKLLDQVVFHTQHFNFGFILDE